MKKALIIGANGTIGGAIAELMGSTEYRAHYELHTVTQADTDYSVESLPKLVDNLSEKGEFHTIICCIGVLHNDIVAPEKRLAQLQHEVLAEYFRVNTILPALCLSHFSKLLSKSDNTQFAFLSAMVGSISDNALGGWYGYRSSKAALNMMVKTASVEMARTHKRASLAVIHPGTTQGPLSKPFAGGVAKSKYYTPEQSAQRIVSVVESLTPEQSGSFYNWDGRELAW